MKNQNNENPVQSVSDDENVRNPWDPFVTRKKRFYEKEKKIMF